MHGREAEGVAELGLRERHRESLAVGQADRVELRVQLAEEVRDALVSLPAAKARHPLSENGRLDERVAPEHVADARVRADEGANRLVRDERDLARDARRQRVVHDLDVEALQIGDVAGDMEGEDLPLSAGQDLVAAREAFDDDAALDGRSCSRTMSWSALRSLTVIGRRGPPAARFPKRARCSPACG
jgi:hypothetical protein